jgi:hypothetical protein
LRRNGTECVHWNQGIIAYGAALETEMTFAIIGKEGVPEINLMSIQDFISIPLGKYIRNNLELGKNLKKPPLVFGVNYFLRYKKGKFLNAVRDKHVWVKRENVPGVPKIVFEVLKEQRTRLLEARKKFGDYVSPEKMEVE